MDAEARLYADLDALGIAYDVVEHEAVFTVGESERLYGIMPGAHVKNLFLKDNARRFWLVTVPSHERVALKRLPAVLGCKSVSFAKADDLMRLIGVTPGSVTPLGAINDAEGLVTVALDASLPYAARVNVHPLRNTATVGLAGRNLVRALDHWSHPPLIVSVPFMEQG